MKKLLVALLLWAGLAHAAPLVPGAVSCPVSTCTIYNQAMIHAETGDRIGLAWACVTGCNGPDTEFVVESRRFPPVDTDVPVASAVVPYDKFLWTTFFTKAGAYYQRIRACYIGKRDAASCSVWVNTYDVQQVVDPLTPRGYVFEIKVKTITL